LKNWKIFHNQMHPLVLLVMAWDHVRTEKCYFWWEVWEVLSKRLSLLIKYSPMNCGLKRNWSGASHPNVRPFLIQRLVTTSHASHQIRHFSPEPNPTAYLGRKQVSTFLVFSLSWNKCLVSYFTLNYEMEKFIGFSNIRGKIVI